MNAREAHSRGWCSFIYTGRWSAGRIAAGACEHDQREMERKLLCAAVKKWGSLTVSKAARQDPLPPTPTSGSKTGPFPAPADEKDRMWRDSLKKGQLMMRSRPIQSCVGRQAIAWTPRTPKVCGTPRRSWERAVWATPSGCSSRSTNGRATNSVGFRSLA